MARALNVYALPRLVDPEELAGGTAVVIDVLRSSTTIAYVEVEEARAIAAGLPAGTVLLGGERHGLPIEGFDLGNSPEEYTPQRVGGKTIVLSTTNGTRAMAQARHAKRVLIGAFVNATAVYRQLLGVEQIHLLCSGTEGQYSEDDVLLAGMLVERLGREGGLPFRQNAQATAAREFWLHRFALPQALGAEPLGPEVLAAELCRSAGGRHLVGLGLQADILAAARIDRFGGVPELDVGRFRIRLRREGIRD